MKTPMHKVESFLVFMTAVIVAYLVGWAGGLVTDFSSFEIAVVILLIAIFLKD